MNFLSFDKLFGDRIVPVFYWIGVFFSVVQGILIIFSVKPVVGILSAILLGGISMAFGILIIRIISEVFIALFKIQHDIQIIREGKISKM